MPADPVTVGYIIYRLIKSILKRMGTNENSGDDSSMDTTDEIDFLSF